MGGTPVEEHDALVDYDALVDEDGGDRSLTDIDGKVTAAGLVGLFCVALFASLSDYGVDALSPTSQNLITAFASALAGYLMPNGRHDN